MDENCPATARSAITTGTSIAGRIGVARNESPAVTSIVLCQQEKGTDALRFVFVGEDGEQDAVH
jgi:hypothetical protein